MENEDTDLDVIERDTKTEILYSEESYYAYVNQIHRADKKRYGSGRSNIWD